MLTDLQIENEALRDRLEDVLYSRDLERAKTAWELKAWVTIANIAIKRADSYAPKHNRDEAITVVD